MKQLFPSSPQALQKPARKVGIPKYPWESMKAGESFIVGYDEIKIDSLRPLVSRMGKRYSKKLRVIDHGKETGYEVACLPMTDTEAVQKSSNVVEALNNTGIPNTAPVVKMVSREEAEEYAKLHNISLFEAKVILEKGE